MCLWDKKKETECLCSSATSCSVKVSWGVMFHPGDLRSPSLINLHCSSDCRAWGLNLLLHVSYISVCLSDFLILRACGWNLIPSPLFSTHQSALPNYTGTEGGAQLHLFKLLLMEEWRKVLPTVLCIHDLTHQWLVGVTVIDQGRKTGSSHLVSIIAWTSWIIGESFCSVFVYPFSCSSFLFPLFSNEFFHPPFFPCTWESETRTSCSQPFSVKKDEMSSTIPSFLPAQFHARGRPELCTALFRPSRRLGVKYKAHFLLSQPNALAGKPSETWTWIYRFAPGRFIELSSSWSSSSSSQHWNGNLRAISHRRRPIPYLTLPAYAHSIIRARREKDVGQWHIATISPGKDFNYDKHPSPLLGCD